MKTFSSLGGDKLEANWMVLNSECDKL